MEENIFQIAERINQLNQRAYVTYLPLKEMKFVYPDNLEKVDESYHLSSKMVKDINGNWVLRAFSNKTNNVWNVHASFGR